LEKDNELREHELNADEWHALELVITWLKFFRSAMTQMPATKQHLLSATHIIFRGLQQQLKSIISGLPASTDPALKQGLNDAHPKPSDYFIKFDDSRLEFHTSPSTAGSQKADFTSCYRKRVGTATSDESAEYFRIPSVPEPFDGVDPLQWWYSRHHQSPHLYRLVCIILCIPGEFLCSISLLLVFTGAQVLPSQLRGSSREGVRRQKQFKHSCLSRLGWLARKAMIDLVGD
jgi:hypothetical protein